MSEADYFPGDIAQRPTDARRIQSLIEANPQGLVLSINGVWGTGKSYFLEGLLRKRNAVGQRTFLYNAWEHELADDPLSSFFGETYEYLNQSSPELTVRESGKKLLSAFKLLMKYATPVLTKTLLGFSLDKMGDDVKALLEKSEEGVGTGLSDLAIDLIDRHKATGSMVAQFRKALETVVADVPDGDSPLVIMIDELDRCTPPYLVRFLEVIKHFFEVNRVVFLVALDMDQVRNALQHVYGEAIDSKAYLRKIIGLQYKLLVPPRTAFSDFITGKIKPEGRVSSQVYQASTTLFDRYNIHSIFELSFRDVERFAAFLSGIIHLNQWLILTPGGLTVILAKMVRPDLILLLKNLSDPAPIRAWLTSVRNQDQDSVGYLFDSHLAVLAYCFPVGDLPAIHLDLLKEVLVRPEDQRLENILLEHFANYQGSEYRQFYTTLDHLETDF